MRLRLLWLILVPISLASQQTSAVPARETLDYNIEWRLFSAGKARVQLTQEDRTGYRVNLHLESTGFVSKLFKVEDDYLANLNMAQCAESIQMTTNEGNRQRETKITIDAAAKRASYL